MLAGIGLHCSARGNPADAFRHAVVVTAPATGGTAVVIPFFQRKPGLLANAIRSALSQVDAGPITIVVCDDASPIDADTELAGLAPEQRDRVILVRQANAGAGAARNAALDAVPPGTDWIAFLDSDDRWEPAHIARALAALRAGYDLCFGDALREPQTRTHFQAADLDSRCHEPIGTLPGLFRFMGDFLTLNIAMSPVSISTVVMRASALGDQRFPCMAVEDLMFWFEAARRPIRVAFDATLQVYYGRGDITLVDHWMSPQALKICLLYHRVFMHVRREFSLTPVQHAILELRMEHNRQDFGRVVLGLLRHGRMPAWPVVAKFLRLDPWIARSLLGVAATEVARRLPVRRGMTAG